MNPALLAATLLALFLLPLVSVVQLLFLESLRLRPRDLLAMQFFKETLQGKLGLKTEQGGEAFSLVKHTLLAMLGVLYFAWFADGRPWDWTSFWKSAAAAWVTLVFASYAVPQWLYRRTKGEWLAPLTPLLKALAWLARPWVALLDFFQSLADLAHDVESQGEAPTPAENIEALITAGAEGGLIEEQDRKLMQSVVEFGDKVVREVMTPRPNIVAIPAGATLEELRELVINEQYSRIPVYEGNIDQVIGFVHVRDMFEVDEEEREGRVVSELVRPIQSVPETLPVHELMRRMQHENSHMVIVVDEYGNTAGLATMEDLLEVIIGEIRDEHEPESDVAEDGKGGFVVSGSFDVARITDLFPFFHRDEEIESTTAGGLVTEWLGRVPKSGEHVERDGLRIEVVASDDLRVLQVRLAKSEAVAHET